MNDYYLTPEDYDKAAANGIDAKLLYKRYYMTVWNKNKAINQPKMKTRPRQHIKDWAEVAASNGIGYNTFRARINVYGYSMERAATQPVQDNKIQLKEAREKQKKYPIELIELCKRNGIPSKTFYQRISRGMTPEQAATMPVMGASEKGRKGAMVCAGKRKKPAGCLTNCGQ